MLRLEIRPAAPVSLTSRHINALALDGKLKTASNSFQLECLLHDAVRIMRPLAPPGRRIILHPLVISPQCPLVPWAIMDGQWVMENLLCLLDNAFCYGIEVYRGGRLSLPSSLSLPLSHSLSHTPLSLSFSFARSLSLSLSLSISL